MYRYSHILLHFFHLKQRSRSFQQVEEEFFYQSVGILIMEVLGIRSKFEKFIEIEK